MEEETLMGSKRICEHGLRARDIRYLLEWWYILKFIMG